MCITITPLLGIYMQLMPRVAFIAHGGELLLILCKYTRVTIFDYIGSMNGWIAIPSLIVFMCPKCNNWFKETHKCFEQMLLD